MEGRAFPATLTPLRPIELMPEAGSLSPWWLWDRLADPNLQSRAEFAAKLSIVVEESDESLYWLELVRETDLIRPELMSAIIKEANELVAIVLASRRTAKTLGGSVNRKSKIENRQL